MSFCFLYNVVAKHFKVQNSSGGSLWPAQGLLLAPRLLVDSSFLIHHRPYSLLVCFLCLYIDALGSLYANQMFRATAKAKGDGLDPVKHI